ncbi:MAG: ABC transporter permease [Anaerolineae bacterium]|nr:ABC transporter permease [Anaerolineae bacterium]
MAVNPSRDLAGPLKPADQVSPWLQRRPNPTVRFLQRAALPLIGAAILLLIIAVALLVPLISPFDPYRQDLRGRLQSPGWVDKEGRSHLLGTDQLGRDILTRVTLAARLSLGIGLVAVAGAGLAGVVLGLISGFYGGYFDDIIMRLADLQLALPLILLALAIVALLGPSITNVIIVFIVTGWPVFARTVRASTLSLRQREFIEAARCLGCPTLRILVYHILPNVARPLIVIASFELGKVIIYESSLGFLGMGAQPPTPTWGNMMAEGRAYLDTAWWLVFFPGIALVLTAAAANYIGDGINEFFDPRNKRS